MDYIRIFRLTLFAMVSLLMACGSEVAQRTTSLSTGHNGNSQTSSAWVRAPQKHNNSGIAMRYLIEGELTVGRPVTIKFEFTGTKFDDAHVSFDLAKSLTVNSNAGLQKTGAAYQLALKPSELSAQSINVTPASEGEHFISLQLTQNGQTSAAGVMLRVGEKNKTYDTLGVRVSTEQGEKLIVMPAK